MGFTNETDVGVEVAVACGVGVVVSVGQGDGEGVEVTDIGCCGVGVDRIDVAEAVTPAVGADTHELERKTNRFTQMIRHRVSTLR
jgi:hypothetical protein